jgi:outer membrane protein assembly factor BamD
MLLLTSCATNDVDQLSSGRGLSAKELYDKAMSNISSNNYKQAVQRLENLDSRFPFGVYAEQAQLSLIYAYYKNRDSASAISQADRFIRQHPKHAFVDYAYYMKGMVNFSAEIGFFQEAFSAKLEERDAATARQSFRDFSELVKRFPASTYANDARKRMIYLRNRLARYEIHVARYYMQRKAYLAAANRAKYVIEHFPKSASNADALAIMVNAYDILGLATLAEKSRRTLLLNYPGYQLPL